MVKYMKFFGWSQIAIIRGFVCRTSQASHSSLEILKFKQARKLGICDSYLQNMKL